MTFPLPNNMSKKQRSHDNAGQIGLYAPRSGHMSRERNRRSQYDRGTPAQLQEDAYYHHNGQMAPFNNGYGYVEPGYDMGGPRMPAGPPNYPPMYYGMPPFAGGYMNGPGYPAAPYDGVDPFGNGPFNGNQGYGNGSQGYGNGNQGHGYGMLQGTPASRLRTVSGGRLHRARKPSYGNYTHMPQVVEDEEYPDGNGYYPQGYPGHNGAHGYDGRGYDGRY